MPSDPVNPFLARQARIGQTGRKAERKAAQRLGGKLTPASGAAMAKGDISTTDFLIEAKTTTGDSLGLRYDWLVKITKEAAMVGKAPALFVGFVDPAGLPHHGGNWVCIPERLFKEWQMFLFSRSEHENGP